MDPWQAWLIGSGIIFGIMTLLWLAQFVRRDAGLVDVIWTLCVGGVGIWLIAIAPGLEQRRWILAGLLGIWSLRLAGHILSRVLTQPEDGRYEQMKSQWQGSAAWKMFAFYQLQAFAAVLFILPPFWASANQQPLGAFDYLAIVVWCISVVGEAIADRQLAAFRSNPTNRGKVCAQGLWRYSRHPNYFFEWLHWWCYPLLAIGAPWGWLAFLGPLVMLLLLLFVSGIPPAEAQSLRSRGDAYRRYQATTSAFFPWPPRVSD